MHALAAPASIHARRLTVWSSSRRSSGSGPVARAFVSRVRPAGGSDSRCTITRRDVSRSSLALPPDGEAGIGKVQARVPPPDRTGEMAAQAGVRRADAVERRLDALGDRNARALRVRRHAVAVA